ncbi:hypothetical protein E4U55_001921 [Claviceps digitariae]|nr:hypothetical protein E4U55_001921 [Claviceps digitariae]
MPAQTQTHGPSRPSNTTVDDPEHSKNQASRTATTITPSRDGSSSDHEPEAKDVSPDQRDPERGTSSGDGSERKDEKTGRAGREDDPSWDSGLGQQDGADDEENPKSWAIRRKWRVVICVSSFTFISPVASSMVAPALDTIARDLHLQSQPERVLVLSIFLAAYALGPLAWAPLSELHGRVPVLQSSNLVFLLFNLGCGLARTESQMLACRFLAGIGGSAPLAVGGGVLSDLFAAEERGRAISVYSLMPLLGPAVGPVAGGWIAERTTWRWVFYSTTVVCAVVQVLGLWFLQETYAPVLARRRVMRRRETMRSGYNGAGGGSASDPDADPGPRPGHIHRHGTLLQTLTGALTRPFRLLATEPIVQVLSLYLMFLYGMLYLLLATFPALFATKYGQSPGLVGLNYLSIGLGFFLGAQVCAPLQDRVYAALKRRHVREEGHPGRPEFRVPMMVPGAVLVPAGLLLYAWTADLPTHWLGPDAGAAVFAFGSIIGFQCIQGYIVDAYPPRYAASAMAAITVLRSLAGFGFPLFAPTLYDRMGYGKGGTVLAAVSVVIGWPAPFLLWKYGAALRARSSMSAAS